MSQSSQNGSQQEPVGRPKYWANKPDFIDAISKARPFRGDPVNEGGIPRLREQPNSSPYLFSVEITLHDSLKGFLFSGVATQSEILSQKLKTISLTAIQLSCQMDEPRRIHLSQHVVCSTRRKLRQGTALAAEVPPCEVRDPPTTFHQTVGILLAKYVFEQSALIYPERL
jgi:hypothetical protein